MKIFPSLISADQNNLPREIAKLEPDIDGFHLDIMDGLFVPNTSWGPEQVNIIRSVTSKTLWIHLMVTDPAAYIAQIICHPGDMVSIHYESICNHTCDTHSGIGEPCGPCEGLITEIMTTLRQKGLRTSIALKPKTPVRVLAPYYSLVDQVLIMSVEPGFSGQLMLPGVAERIQQARTLAAQAGYPLRIGLDGGINTTTLTALGTNLPDDIAVAKGIFGAQDPLKALAELRKIAN